MTAESTERAAMDPVMVSFKPLLVKQLGDNLKEVWLFGSRARGDFHEDSDYEVVVVAEGQLKQLRTAVSDANYQILDEYQELVGSIVYTPELWERSKRGPLGMNVRAQGIRLA